MGMGASLVSHICTVHEGASGFLQGLREQRVKGASKNTAGDSQLVREEAERRLLTRLKSAQTDAAGRPCTPPPASSPAHTHGPQLSSQGLTTSVQTTQHQGLPESDTCPEEELRTLQSH